MCVCVFRKQGKKSAFYKKYILYMCASNQDDQKLLKLQKKYQQYSSKNLGKPHMQMNTQVHNSHNIEK